MSRIGPRPTSKTGSRRPSVRHDAFQLKGVHFLLGLSRFASQRRDNIDRLKKEDAVEWMAATILERVRKAENLANEIVATPRKLRDLKDQGKV